MQAVSLNTIRPPAAQHDDDYSLWTDEMTRWASEIFFYAACAAQALFASE